MHIGLGGLLFLVFLVLKLTGIVAWSWLWVLAPLWIPVVLTVLVVGIGVVFSFRKTVKAEKRQAAARKAYFGIR
jgi:hypothetical protein